MHFGTILRVVKAKASLVSAALGSAAHRCFASGLVQVCVHCADFAVVRDLYLCSGSPIDRSGFHGRVEEPETAHSRIGPCRLHC